MGEGMSSLQGWIRRFRGTGSGRGNGLAAVIGMVAIAGAIGLTSSCGGGDDEPVGLELTADARAQGCDDVIVGAALEGTPEEVRWEVHGYPVLHLERLGRNAGVQFRAPVVNTDVNITIAALAIEDDGTEIRREVTVTVEAAPQGPTLASGMAFDCAPFVHGVASGDPHTDSVLIWTSVEEPATPGDIALNYVVATDIHLAEIVAEGSITARADTDYTAEVEVTGLQPGTTYYYRFSDRAGNASVMGRTRTAPVQTDHVRIVSMSCSSVFSGYFNGYARIAELEDVDLCLHMGDYVYDTVDPDEKVRMPPGPEPTDPTTIEEWRERYRYYLGDPDFRRARQVHPWAAMWDNHEAPEDPDEANEQSDLVFREYVPTRMPVAGRPEILYRTLRFGDLVDVILADQTYNEKLGIPNESKFGQPQWEWLTETITNSSAAWRVFATQKLGAPFLTPATISFAGVSGFDEYPQTRQDLYDLLGIHGDNLYLSGDLHFVVAADMVADPTNYDRTTGVGSVGGELLASSITRGNFDETLCSGLCPPETVEVIETIGDLLYDFNPHFVYDELIQHGFGVNDITPDRIESQVHFTPIRRITPEVTLGPLLTMDRGANRWNP